MENSCIKFALDKHFLQQNVSIASENELLEIKKPDCNLADLKWTVFWVDTLQDLQSACNPKRSI